MQTPKSRCPTEVDDHKIGYNNIKTKQGAYSMVNIDELKPLIVERLKPLKPDKIILFGSYAYGTPTEESDIDLFLLKDDLKVEDTRDYQRRARSMVLDLVLSHIHIRRCRRIERCRSRW